MTSPTPVLATVEEIDEVTSSAAGMWEAFVAALPRVGIAVVLAAAGWVVNRLVRSAAHRVLERTHPPSFATVMSKLAGWLVLATAVMFGVTIVFPSVAPVDMLAGLGFFSVAVGFAFQDILENLLAGILLLFRQPFSAGDQVEVNGHVGSVDSITIRETRLRTFDGQRVLVPNADVYKNAIRVQTAFPVRRIDLCVGVSYATALDLARRTLEQALTGIDGIAAHPPPEALLSRFGTATIDFDVRFWCQSSELAALRVRDEAIEELKSALDRAGIEMPADIVALQATSSFAAALRGERVTPGGGVPTVSGPAQ